MSDSTARILVVDDEPDILEFLSYNLVQDGYQVKSANNGSDALKIGKTFRPHLILLDIMMPDMDGVTACHKFRANSNYDDTLIAFLTARKEEYSEIACLAAGADDYIFKPISPRLLKSRVNALLRRHKHLSKPKEVVIDLGSLKLDKERFEVYVDNKIIDLARKEFEILWLLAEKPGKVFSRKEIYRHVWGTEVIVGNRTIDVHISKLRNKLKDKFIKTVKGVGYRIG